MKTAKSKTLAAPLGPSASEIEDIRERCQFIARTVTRLLPEALYVGEWFTEQKEKYFMHGEWEPWLAQSFPELGQSTVQMYMQLAKYRLQLEEHFGQAIAALPKPEKKSRPKSTQKPNVRHLPVVVVEKIPTISEARAYIAELNKQDKQSPGKKGKKPPKKKAKRGPQNTLPDEGVARVQEFYQTEIVPFVETFEPNEQKAVWDWLAGLCHQSLDENPNINGAEPA